MEQTKNMSKRKRDNSDNIRAWFNKQFAVSDAKNVAFFEMFDALHERQLLALRLLTERENLFVTGCAGTGKTLWLRTAIATMQSMGKSVAVCATTALAASNIDVLTPADQMPTNSDRQTSNVYSITPQTLHSWAGIGIGEDFDPYTLARQFLTLEKYRFVKNRWIYTDVLFIDEVSMLSPKIFVSLDKLAQLVRKSARPFGGLQVVLVADFFQLPPVMKVVPAAKIQIDVDASREAFERELVYSDSDDDDDDDEATRQYQSLRHERRYTTALRKVQLERQRKLQQAYFASVAPATEEQETLLLTPNEKDARYCFQTKSWRETVDASIVFNHVFRQRNPAFIDLLGELRAGVLSPASVEQLGSRTHQRLEQDLLDIAFQLFDTDRLLSVVERVAKEQSLEHVDTAANFGKELVVPNWSRFQKYLLRNNVSSADIESSLIYLLPDAYVPPSHEMLVSDVEPTHIMPLVSQVEQLNADKLSTLKGDVMQFAARVSIDTSDDQLFERAQQHFAQEFAKQLTPLQLRLKVGAQVLLTCNLEQRFYNGRRGIVAAFMNRIEFESTFPGGELLGAVGDDAERVPVVRFDNSLVVRCGRYSWRRQHTFHSKPVSAVLSQFPLALAFAITIHKSQGMTINRLCVDLTNTFEHGLAYVALSRATSLDSIVIKDMNLDGSKLLPAAEVVAFYNKLQRESVVRC
jgi:hypothetical protein